MFSGRNPMMFHPCGRSPPATPTQYYTQKRFRKGAYFVLRTETRGAAAELDNTAARLPLTSDFSVTDDVASSQEMAWRRSVHHSAEPRSRPRCPRNTDDDRASEDERGWQ